MGVSSALGRRYEKLHFYYGGYPSSKFGPTQLGSELEIRPAQVNSTIISVLLPTPHGNPES